MYMQSNIWKWNNLHRTSTERGRRPQPSEGTRQPPHNRAKEKGKRTESGRALHPGERAVNGGGEIPAPWQVPSRKNPSSLQNPKRGDLLRRPAPPLWAPPAEMSVCRRRWGLGAEARALGTVPGRGLGLAAWGQLEEVPLWQVRLRAAAARA